MQDYISDMMFWWAKGVYLCMEVRLFTYLYYRSLEVKFYKIISLISIAIRAPSPSVNSHVKSCTEVVAGVWWHQDTICVTFYPILQPLLFEGCVINCCITGFYLEVINRTRVSIFGDLEIWMFICMFICRSGGWGWGGGGGEASQNIDAVSQL